MFYNVMKYSVKCSYINITIKRLFTEYNTSLLYTDVFCNGKMSIKTSSINAKFTITIPL